MEKPKVKIKWNGYEFTIGNIAIQGPDRSVGIFNPSIEDFEILDIKPLGKKKRSWFYDDVEEDMYAHFSNQDDEALKIEDLIFAELYKIERKKCEESWKRYKAQRRKAKLPIGLKRDFMSEWCD